MFKSLVEALSEKEIIMGSELHPGYAKLLQEIRKRLSRHYNNIIIVDGDVGTGKSTLCLDLAWRLDPVYRYYPEVAAKYFVCYSSRELVDIINFLVVAGKEGEVFRGRWIIGEEMEKDSNLAIGAVRELLDKFDAIRQWQINFVLNLPLATRISQLKYELANFAVFTFARSTKKRVVYARWRMRYRDETQVAFVHPAYIWHKKYVDQRAEEVPGMFMKVPYCDAKLWEAYQREKQGWFEQSTVDSVLRIRRLAMSGRHLSSYFARPWFKRLEDYVLSVQENV